jgi:hypothetical protein
MRLEVFNQGLKMLIGELCALTYTQEVEVRGSLRPRD